MEGACLKTLELPHGPWKTIIAGIWSEREIAYLENPDKDMLVLVYDKRGDAIKGMVFFMVKLFTLEGNVGSFAENAGENTVFMHKHTSTYTGSFLAIATNPEYVKFSPRELISATEKHYDELEKRAAEARRKSNDYSVKLIEAKYSSIQHTNELFGEPLAMPSLVIRKEGPGLVSTKQTGRLHLGITLDNKKAEENVKSFLLTIVHGKNNTRALHVLMEGCVMNGVSGVVFEGFEKAETPNLNTDEYVAYQVEADPMGMPIRRFKPGQDYFINLSLLDKELFGDISGAGQGKAIELIGQALKKEPSTLDELIHKLHEVREEENKYFAAQAIRICKLMQLSYPGLFDGKLEPKEIVAPWLKHMGRLAIVDTQGMNPTIKKGLIYCTLKTLYDNYKKEFGSSDIKVLVLVSDPELYGNPITSLDKRINSLIKMVGEYGIGICVNAQTESDVDQDIKLNATMNIQTMEGNNASVSEHTKKPYRIKIRPTLSAM